MNKDFMIGILKTIQKKYPLDNSEWTALENAIEILKKYEPDHPIPFECQICANRTNKGVNK